MAGRGWELACLLKFEGKGGDEGEACGGEIADLGEAVVGGVAGGGADGGIYPGCGRIMGVEEVG